MSPFGIGVWPRHVAAISARAFIAVMPVSWGRSTVVTSKLIAMARIAIRVFVV